MSRILLADDSPHAQRMGERILRDEGHEVITVSDGLVAMLRLKDARPDLIIADISMPEVSGYELCEYIKGNGGAPVFLTAGAVEPVDEAEVSRVRADGVLKKPFEASLLLEAIGRFVTGAKRRAEKAEPKAEKSEKDKPRSVVIVDQDLVRAAVTVALDAAMPALIDEISARVLAAMSGQGRSVTRAAAAGAAAPGRSSDVPSSGVASGPGPVYSPGPGISSGPGIASGSGSPEPRLRNPGYKI